MIKCGSVKSVIYLNSISAKACTNSISVNISWIWEYSRHYWCPGRKLGKENHLIFYRNSNSIKIHFEELLFRHILVLLENRNSTKTVERKWGNRKCHTTGPVFTHTFLFCHVFLRFFIWRIKKRKYCCSMEEIWSKSDSLVTSLFQFLDQLKLTWFDFSWDDAIASYLKEGGGEWKSNEAK